MSGEAAIERNEELVLPGEVRPLEVQDVQAPRQDRDERADLVVRPEQLPFLGLDPEGDLLLARGLGDVLQAR